MNTQRQVAEAKLIVDLITKKIQEDYSSNGDTFKEGVKVNVVVPVVIIHLINAMAAQQMLDALEQQFNRPQQGF